jgi:hypothetical protein
MREMREKKEKKKKRKRKILGHKTEQQRQRETEKRGEKVPPAPVFFGSRRCMAFFG